MVSDFKPWTLLFHMVFNRTVENFNAAFTISSL